MTNEIIIRKSHNDNRVHVAGKSSGRFDWWYMFIMVIYMGMATPETTRMVGNLSGNPIPFLLPMILTYALYVKHGVYFKDGNYTVVVSIYLIWTVLSLIKWHEYSTGELSFYFFPLYNIIVAYVQVRAFGKDLIPLYEDVILTFAKISLVLWAIFLLHIPFFEDLASDFPATSTGNSILYIFTWPDISKYDQGVYIDAGLRNFGCSWEPGRFSIMLVLGIYCNICRNGVKFKGNSNVIWLLAALFSTFSTTGIVATVFLYLISLIKRITPKNFIIIIACIPVLYGIYSLDFVGNKINTKLNESADVSRLDDQFSYNAKVTKDNEYLGSIDRFDSAVFEMMNLKYDPILGYSNNFSHSYFYRTISKNYVLANGLVNIFSGYGIIFGLIIFYWLFKSSIRIAGIFPGAGKYGLFVAIVLCAVSYKIFAIPVFTAFWLFGEFYNSSEDD